MSKDRHSHGQKGHEDGKYNRPHSITPVDHAVHSVYTLDKIQKDNDE